MRSLHFVHSSFSSHIKKLQAAFCEVEQYFVRTWCVFEPQKPQVVFDGVFEIYSRREAFCVCHWLLLGLLITIA
jgi:hypothetical protein